MAKKYWQMWAISEAKYVSRYDSVKEKRLKTYTKFDWDKMVKDFEKLANQGKAVYWFYNDSEHQVSIIAESEKYRKEYKKIKD